MTRWVDFAEIRSRVTLANVIFDYYHITNLVRHGDKLVGPCPVHGGNSSRAFHADLSKNVWHCFSKCQRGGNQLDFVAVKEGISVREAALRLQQAFLNQAKPPPTTSSPQPPASPPPVYPPVSPPAIVATAPSPAPSPTPPADTSDSRPERNPPLNVKLALKADYPYLLNQRGLDVKTIHHFGIGYCGQGILRGCVAVPVHDDRCILVAYAGRRTKPSDIETYGKYKFPKGFRKELVLFNYHNAVALAPDKGLILVEGFFSVFKLHQLGFPNTVACMGCEVSDFQTELLSKAKEVILLLDGDDAGRTGTERAKDKLKDRTVVRVAHLPDGWQPDDLPQRTLRWLIGGLQILDLADVCWQFRDNAQPTDSSTPDVGTLTDKEDSHGREK